MTKKELCKGQREGLIAKLTALFEGLEAEIIDDVVAEAKKQANRKIELAKLFDSQIETLKSRNCPQTILKTFQDKKSEVLSKATEMKIPERNIPFIPVIPRSYLGIYGLMPMVKNGDKIGYTYLDPNKLTDNVEVPKSPYYIYDVKDGKDMFDKSPKKAEKLIKEQNRSCLTADEGIALCVHSRVLSKHYVDCTGSRCRHLDGVPYIFLVSDEPRLDWYDADSLNEKWGSASCRSRT